MMSKDPRFNFYSADFLTGTILMTDEQVGKYIRLLCVMHQKGRLSKEHMINICKSYDEDVFSKFKQDENGLYYNERLEVEVEKSRKYSESRRKNRMKKDMKNISKTHEEHMSPHMENEKENEKENREKRKRTENKKEVVFPFDSKKFLETWELWKQYKKEQHRFTYKSIISEQGALKKLSDLSEQEAIEAIHLSIDNGWKGLFPEKIKTNGNRKGKTDFKFTDRHIQPRG